MADGVGEGSAAGFSSSDVQPARASTATTSEGESPHAVVAAQQTDRRLPAFHSPSWNHV